MASRDDPDLDDMDKVRLALDYAPAEALESVADDEEELALLASLDERLDRQVEATRVRDATVVVERPPVVELLGVTCGECGTPFEVETGGPLPRAETCPECGVEGVLEPAGEAAIFDVPDPEAQEEPGDADHVAIPEPPEHEAPEPEAPEPEEEPEDEGGVGEAFAVPEEEGEGVAILAPADEDEAGAAPMEPAVDPAEALVPDDEEAGDVEEAPEEDEAGDVEEDEEFTFTPPTAQEEDETDDAVQELLEEDLDLEDDEDEGEADEDRPGAFDDVDWPEDEADEDEAFSVVGPAEDDPDEPPDPEEELVEPEDEGDWPEDEAGADEAAEEPEWPELRDEEGDEGADEDDEGWPELEDDEEEAGGNPGNDASDEGGNPNEAAGDDAVPSEWAGRDLEAEEGPAEPEPGAGQRGGLPVDQIPGVTSFYAGKLEETGYGTTADLAADEARRVSERTGIASALVEKWSRAASLVQEAGLGAGYATLLAEEVEGPDDLQDRDPGALAETVNDLVDEADQDLDPVAAKDVAGWVGGG